MALSIGIAVKANGASSATTASQTTTAGSAIQVQVTCTVGSGSPPTVTDSKGNTYTLIGSGVQVSATPGSTFIYKNEGGGTRGSSHTWSVTANDVTILVVEILGTNPVVDTNSTGNTDSASPYESGSITPSVADFCLVGTVAADGSVTSWTAGASFTKQLEETNHSSYWPAALGTLLVTGGSGSYLTSWTTGTSSGTYGLHVVAWKESGPAPELEQEGARFRNDDGSETTATWAAAQDSNITAPIGANLRLRMLVNATLDPASSALTLRYQKNGAGGYVAVPVGASVAESYGTVTFGAIGTGANGSTSVAPSYPSGITAGQYLVCVVTSGATSSETPSTPSGWTLLATGASTDGTFGVDTGPRRVTVFGKVADGTETGTLTVSITNGNTCRGTISRFTKSGPGAWDIEAQGGNDSTSGTGFSATLASMNWNTGDATLVAVGQRVDTVTQSSQSLTASGVTFGTRTNRASTAVTTGNDHRHVVDTFAAITSTSDVDAAPTWAYTGSAACSGGVVIVRLREYTAPVANEVYISPSANITAGGEATTAQLTAPSGKSNGDFVTGRLWDDENGADAIDITTDDYTELEYCVRGQSPLVNGDYVDFRVYAGSSALDTYTVTPRWTIGSSGYSLAMGQGTYTGTGQAVALRAARTVAAAQGSYSLTGQAVAMSRGRPMAMAQGSYTLSGQSVGLAAARKLAAAQGSYAVSGQAVTLIYSPTAKTIQIEQGAYSLTGRDAALRIARRLAAAQGSYALTGQAVGLKFGHKLIAAQGTYTVTGSDAVCDFAITISSGTYTLTGQAADLRASRTLAMGQGSYSLTGQAVAVRAGRKSAAAQGSYSLIGQDIGLTYSGAGAKTITIAQGSYALSGQAAGLWIARNIAAGAGSYAITGQAAALGAARRLSLSQGAYSLTGQAVTFQVSRVLSAEHGTYANAGQSVGVLSARRLTLSQGGYTLTGTAAVLYPSRRIAAGQGSYSLTGSAAALSATRRMAIAAGSYSLTGQSIAFNYSGALTPISPERTYLVRAENRRYLVTAENRAYSVRAENRTWRVTT